MNYQVIHPNYELRIAVGFSNVWFKSEYFDLKCYMSLLDCESEEVEG